MNSLLEKEIGGLIKDRGYGILHSGWPDFLVFNSREAFMVEVKDIGDRLRENQSVMHKTLKRFGVPVRVIKRKDIKKIDEKLLEIPRIYLSSREEHLKLIKIETELRTTQDTLHKLQYACLSKGFKPDEIIKDWNKFEEEGKVLWNKISNLPLNRILNQSL